MAGYFPQPAPYTTTNNYWAAPPPPGYQQQRPNAGFTPNYPPNAFQPPGQTFTPSASAIKPQEMAQLKAMADQLKPLGINFDMNAVSQMVSMGMPLEQAVLKQMEAAGLPVNQLLGGAAPGGMPGMPGMGPMPGMEDPQRSGGMVRREDGTVWDTKSNSGGMGFFSKALFTVAALAIAGFGFRKFGLAKNELVGKAVNFLKTNKLSKLLVDNPVSNFIKSRTPDFIKEPLANFGKTIRKWLGYGAEAAEKTVKKAAKKK